MTAHWKLFFAGALALPFQNGNDQLVARGASLKNLHKNAFSHSSNDKWEGRAIRKKKKTDIHHFPHGQPFNFKTIAIGMEAWPGDLMGSCEELGVGNAPACFQLGLACGLDPDKNLLFQELCQAPEGNVGDHLHDNDNATAGLTTVVNLVRSLLAPEANDADLDRDVLTVLMGLCVPRSSRWLSDLGLQSLLAPVSFNSSVTKTTQRLSNVQDQRCRDLGLENPKSVKALINLCSTVLVIVFALTVAGISRAVEAGVRAAAPALAPAFRPGCSDIPCTISRAAAAHSRDPHKTLFLTSSAFW